VMECQSQAVQLFANAVAYSEERVYNWVGRTYSMAESRLDARLDHEHRKKPETLNEP